jgi:hypothetical protein
MRTLILSYLILIIGISAYAQSTDKWTAFYNKETELKGFQNAKGVIMIKPTISWLTSAQKFDHIMAMSIEMKDSIKTYYLTKSGREIGFDSLHIYDNGTDCESEGYIRFRDKKTDMVGMFDRDGNIAIPAIYNELSRVNNGLIWALKDATKEFYHKKTESGCNHYGWKGGQELLINTKNDVIVINTQDHYTLDCFSMTIENEPSSDSTRVSFEGTNGKYYSFTDFEKEFLFWVKTDLISDISLSKIKNYTMDSLTNWHYKDDLNTESKEAFLSRNYGKIEDRFRRIQSNKTDLSVTLSRAYQYIYVEGDREKYFNNCGESRWQKYPQMTLIINSGSENNLKQDHIDFLKTDNGYRLISATFRH